MVPSEGELAEVLCENLVLKEMNKPAISSDQKTVLKGGVQSGAYVSTMNQFTCFPISNTNGSLYYDKVYTDTDCDGKLKIITDIQVKGSLQTMCHTS